MVGVSGSSLGSFGTEEEHGRGSARGKETGGREIGRRVRDGWREDIREEWLDGGKERYGWREGGAGRDGLKDEERKEGEISITSH